MSREGIQASYKAVLKGGQLHREGEKKAVGVKKDGGLPEDQRDRRHGHLCRKVQSHERQGFPTRVK